MDFLIHWPPGPVVATVQCQSLLSGPATHYFFVALSFRRFMTNNPVHIIGIERPRPQSDKNKIKKMKKIGFA